MASSVHIGSDGLGPGGDRLLIVHDQAADLGGHERALEALLGHYPAANAMAPHFTPTNRPEGHRTAWDGRSRLVGRGGRRSSFLAPVYARRLAGTGVQDADVVLSITQGGWSLAARVAPGAIHLCYSGGLPGHLYGQSRLYLGHEPRPLRPLIAVALPGLRAHDRRMMRRPRRVIANSAFSASELRRIHGREAEVVHPPVRTDFFTPGDAPRQLFLVVARLIASKRVDLVVEAFRGLEEELVVAGGGPMLEELRRAAPRNVRFVGPCDDETLRDLYRRSRALICPSLETFGIAMTEAHAWGDHGDAARVRLRHHDSELLDRRADECAASAIELPKRGVVDPAGEAHVRRRSRSQAVHPGTAAGDHERLVEVAEGVDQVVELLLRDQPTDREEVALPPGRGREEVRADGRVDHLGAPAVHALDGAGRERGVRDHAVRAAHQPPVVGTQGRHGGPHHGSQWRRLGAEVEMRFAVERGRRTRAIRDEPSAGRHRRREAPSARGEDKHHARRLHRRGGEPAPVERSEEVALLSARREQPGADRPRRRVGVGAHEAREVVGDDRRAREPLGKRLHDALGAAALHRLGDDGELVSVLARVRPGHPGIMVSRPE